MQGEEREKNMQEANTGCVKVTARTSGAHPRWATLGGGEEHASLLSIPSVQATMG